MIRSFPCVGVTVSLCVYAILVREPEQMTAMKRLMMALVLILLSAGTAQAQFEWAYQRVDKVLPQQDLDFDEDAPREVLGSSLILSQKEIDGASPPDWFPEDHHAPVPDIVAHGAPPEVGACSRCHGYAGSGHPESSHITGMTADYIVRQMADFKSGARKDPFRMNRIAANVSDEDVRAAAEWYAGIEPIDWIDEVIESDTVPITYLGRGRMRFLHPDGGTEPIGNRVLEVPQNRSLVEFRHPYEGFTVYAPAGSVARGEDLVTTGASGKTIACFICHGEGLTGLGDVPRLAGISPLYVVRQLNEFQNGDRAGSLGALMNASVANLTTEDIIDIAAYLATLDP